MLWLLVLGAIGVHAAPALAQQPAPAPQGDPANAATWYRAAYAEAQRIGFNNVDYEPVWAFHRDPDRGPSAEARSIMRRSREACNLTKRGSRRASCDFGPFDPFEERPDYSSGALRALAKVLQDDFLLGVFDGDVSEAMEDVGCVLRISRHSASRGAMMPVLVGAAILYFGDNLIKHAIDRAIIGPGEATRLLREFGEFKGDDPLGYRNAIIVGQTEYIDGLIKRYSADDGLQRLRDDQMGYYQQQDDRASIAILEQMTRDDLVRMLDALRDMQDRIVRATRLEDPAATKAALEAIDNESQTGKYGRVLQFALGGTPKTFDQMQRARKLLDDRIIMLKGIADGTVDPLSLANAACWYIRASVKIEQVDPAALALIDAHAAKADLNADIDPTLAEGLVREDVRGVLELLTTAATIDRCDFSYATGNWATYYRPYHAGALACGRLLAVETMRLLREGKRDLAIARLSQMCRLSSNLARDDCLAGTLAAHRIFDSANAIIASLDERGLDPESRAALTSALERFSRSDPFHYQPAIASLRTHARWWVSWLSRGAPSAAAEQIAAVQKPTTQQETDDADAILNQCDADRVLSILAACEEQSVHWNQVRNPIRPPIDGLWPIFGVDALQRCREMLPAMRQWAKMRVITALPQADLPRIAPIEVRARQSIDDFRVCAERLGLAASGESTAWPQP